MPHRSSTSALISVIHDWMCVLDSGKEVCVVFFDIRKAFDSVPHVLLLQKLTEIGLDPCILRWIKNYLTDRKQFVVVNGSTSNMLPVLSGVPQGSVLGPLLFIIYINEIVHQISQRSYMNLFAHDIALYRDINTADDYVQLQEDINAVSAFLTLKHLNLNTSKCCHLLLTRKRAHSVLPPVLTLDDVPLASVTSYKYLGVVITSDLMWSTHVTTICNKTRRLVGMLYRQFYKHSSKDTLLKLYTSLVRPHLEYAASAWDPFLKKDITLLEEVQKFALKVCTKQWDLNYNDLVSLSHLPTLQDRRQQSKLCWLFNIVNGHTYFPNSPLQNRDIHYATRSSHAHALVPIQCHTLQFQSSYFPSTINAWNSLSPDLELVSVQSSTGFKHALSKA